MSFESLRDWYRSLFLPGDRLFYLAVFRALAGLLLCCKILAIWPSTRFLFGPNGLYEYPANSAMSLKFISLSGVHDHLSLFYAGYFFASGLMVVGIGRRWTVAAVLVATAVHQDLNWILLDGGDNLLQFSLLYLVFADSFAHLTLWKTSRSAQRYTLSNLFTNIAVAALIAHLCLVYLVSGLSKAHAEVWYNGTAMYYILLGDRFQGTPLNAILAKNALFNFLACYITIIWEATFPFSVFVKRLRVPILLMGLAMHLSIFALMMIQSFQFIYIAHYGFFFSDVEWAAAVEKVHRGLRRRVGSFLRWRNRAS